MKLHGTIAEILYDERKMTLTLCHTVNIELDYTPNLDSKIEQLMEGCEVEATAEITGWRVMSYPHLTHDVLAGTMQDIEEIW